MASINNLMSNLGWLIGISLGLVVPVQYYSLVLASPSLVFLALSWRIPESPIWQIRNGMKEAGRATLVWLRGAKYNVEVELAELEEIVREEKRQTSDQTITSSLLNRTFLWPLVISCFLFTFSALSGAELISYYTGFIFSNVGLGMERAAILYQVSSRGSASENLTFLQLTITVGYLLSPLLLSRLDCKYINTIFHMCSALAMITMGLSFKLPGLRNMSTLGLVMSGLAYGLGVGPVSYVLMSELYTQGTLFEKCLLGMNIFLLISQRKFIF